MARLGGRDLCYLFVLPPAIWLYLRNAAPRHGLLAYWRRLRPGLRGPIRHVVGVGHYWTFARMLADRLLMALAPRALRYEQIGLTHLDAAMARAASCSRRTSAASNWQPAGWLRAIRRD